VNSLTASTLTLRTEERLTDATGVTNVSVSAGAGRGYAILLDQRTPSNQKGHIRNNTILGNTTAFTVAGYDCTDCDADGNVIDGGGLFNRNWPTDEGSGYGIAYYSSATTYRNRVTNNIVRNTAGNGIYFQYVADAVVSANTLDNTCQ